MKLLSSRYLLNMQNIANRMLMECFLRCNNGSQVDVLDGDCVHKNILTIG